MTAPALDSLVSATFPGCSRLALLLAFVGALAQSPLHAQVSFEGSRPQPVYAPGSGRYAYAPSIVDVDGARHIFTCHNRDPLRIRDDIFETVLAAGHISQDRPVLAHSLSGWDSFHVCDPSVLRTHISYNKTVYRWIMFYLGNDVDRSARNGIGFALAESIDGPWVRYPSPVVPNPAPDSWGVGQPSALPLQPESSTFALLYTDSTNRQCALSMTTVDLTDLDHPRIAPSRPMPCDGLPSGLGLAPRLTNVDLAWEPGHRRIFAIADASPYPKSAPTYITDRLLLLSIDAPSLLQGKGRWTTEAVITPQMTGFPRNHNAGLVRGPNGDLSSANGITVVFTRSCSADTPKPCDGRPEWTYDLWELTGKR